MTDEKWINWTLVRRLNHGRMSRALCLEAGDRIEELQAKLGAVMETANELLVELNDVTLPLGADELRNRLDETLQLADQEQEYGN